MNSRGFYFVAEQTVWRKVATDKKDNSPAFGVFTRPGYMPANFGFVSRYVEGGFNFTGLLPNRHDDVFGVGATHSGISGVASRLSSQTGGPRYGAETLVEAAYTITVKSWLKLQPDFQHIFDPGARRGARDAAVLGLRTNLIF